MSHFWPSQQSSQHVTYRHLVWLCWVTRCEWQSQMHLCRSELGGSLSWTGLEHYFHLDWLLLQEVSRGNPSPTIWGYWGIYMQIKITRSFVEEETQACLQSARMQSSVHIHRASPHTQEALLTSPAQSACQADWPVHPLHFTCWLNRTLVRLVTSNRTLVTKNGLSSSGSWQTPGWDPWVIIIIG